MRSPDRPRFSIRALMVYVVVVGVCLAGSPARDRIGVDEILVMQIGHDILECVLLIACFVYRDLSRWLWLVIASQLLQPLISLFGLHTIVMGTAVWPVMLNWFSMLGVGVLGVTGICMTLRAVHRQLVARPAPARMEREAPLLPDAGV